LKAALLLALFGAPSIFAQSVQIFSEFQRVDPFGNTLGVDRSPSPREIISPAVARNSFASFHLAVSVPRGQTYFLFVQANPPGILGIHLYKEQFLHYQDEWIPDTLAETALPSFGVIPDAQANIPGQTTRDYLLDLWVPPDAEIGRRVRVEVLLKYGTWVVVPMEVRITPALVPAPGSFLSAPLPGIFEPADAAAMRALAAHLSGLHEWNRDPILSVRGVLRRNAQQDMALAAAHPTPELWLRAAGQIVNSWTMFPIGAEWYLRVRDLLISRSRP